ASRRDERGWSRRSCWWRGRGRGRYLPQKPLEHGIAGKALGEPLHVAAGLALEHRLPRGIARRLAHQRGGEYPRPLHLGEVAVVRHAAPGADRGRDVALAE